jgi:hypothetical protein
LRECSIRLSTYNHQPPYCPHNTALARHPLRQLWLRLFEPSTGLGTAPLAWGRVHSHPGSGRPSPARPTTTTTTTNGGGSSSAKDGEGGGWDHQHHPQGPPSADEETGASWAVGGGGSASASRVGSAAGDSNTEFGFSSVLDLGRDWEEEEDADEWCVCVCVRTCVWFFLWAFFLSGVVVSMCLFLCVLFFFARGIEPTRPQHMLTPHTYHTPTTNTNRDDLNCSRHGSILPGRLVFSMSRPQIEADEWEIQSAAGVDRSGHSVQSAHSAYSSRPSPGPHVGNTSPRSAPAQPSHLRPGSAPPPPPPPRHAHSTAQS